MGSQLDKKAIRFLKKSRFEEKSLKMFDTTPKSRTLAKS